MDKHAIKKKTQVIKTDVLFDAKKNILFKIITEIYTR